MTLADAPTDNSSISGSDDTSAAGAGTGRDTGVTGTSGDDSGSILGDAAKADDSAKKGTEDSILGDTKDTEGAPEKYEEFKLEEGVSWNPEILNSFETLARKHNLSQEAAQAFVDLAAQNEKQTIESFSKQHAELMSEWVSGIKNDPEFGGYKFGETQERARRVVRKFGSPELLDSLRTSGYGNYPELIKAFARIDRAMGEDTSVNPKVADAKKSMSVAEIFYPTMVKGK
jgi:hypothetical protein